MMTLVNLHSRNIFYSIFIALSFPICINSQIIVSFNKIVVVCVLPKWSYNAIL